MTGGYVHRPPPLSEDERAKRRGIHPVDRLACLPARQAPRPWLHDLYGDALMYRWLIKNRLMRNDDHGVELTYKTRTDADEICGARTIRPGIPDFKGYSWRMDQSVDHEVVCTAVGDHGEMPHVGVPADCADMTCQCFRYGCDHLVIVGFAVKPGADNARSQSGDPQ